MKRRDFIQAGASAVVAAGALQLEGWTLLARQASAASPPREKLPPELIALNRICFGPRPEDIAAVRELGKTPAKRLHGFVEQQLHPEQIPDAECDAMIEKGGFEAYKKTIPQAWADHFVAANKIRDAEKEKEPKPEASAAPRAGDYKGGSGAVPEPSPSPAKPAKNVENELRMQPVREVERITWIRAIHSRRQLQEVMADFWHNHFNIYAWENQTAPVFAVYDREVIRKHLLGNFRQMLEAVATSPAMLFYLDNYINQSGNPNENYARELFELHTLGAENYLGTRARTEVPGYAEGHPTGYVDGDVYEAARCLTGWRVETGNKTAESGEFSYFDPWHDRFQKIVLGHPLPEYQPPMKDGQDVLDLLSDHPGTSRFIARKLCRRLVSDTPPEALVRRAAKVFHDNRKHPEQIRLTVREILLSPEFARGWGQKIKRPFEFAASAVRATGARFDATPDFLGKYSALGQPLFRWRSPDGYPDARDAWTGATALASRWRFCNQLAGNHIDGSRIELSQSTSPTELALRMLGRPLSRGSADSISHFLETAKPGPNERPATALALMLMSPEFQWR